MEYDILLEQLRGVLIKVAEWAKKMAQQLQKIFSWCNEYEETKPESNPIYIPQHKHSKAQSPKMYSASIKVPKNLPYMRRNY